MKKIAIAVAVLLVLALIVGFTVKAGSRNATLVQTGKASREELSSVVSASGQIKPKTQVNIGANAYGRIIKLYVKEGDHVSEDQLLAQLESVQPAADLQSQKATLEALRTDAEAAVAAEKTDVAGLAQAKADLSQKELEFRRAKDLLQSQLIAKSDYDSKSAAYDMAVATVAQAEARLAQARASHDSTASHVAAQQATLRHFSDVLSKTIYKAPFRGVITNLPVHEGESVVVGIQNAQGSTLMTIADMSVITAEVQVDETDIVNVKLGQPADVSIDAIPGTVFKARVTEIGNNAIIRSSGLSTAQSTTGSQEAKDFKVVVTLDHPPDNLRPGLSTTAKIITASKQDALAIPIQALAIRQRSELQPQSGKGSLTSAKPQSASTKEAKDAAKEGKEELQGVFVVRNVGGSRRAEFVPVQTGVTGNTDVEVTSGLKENDEVVTGSYKVLRTLRNGTAIKIDNSVTAAKEKDDKS